MNEKIAIIDYGMGNHFSIQKKLARLGCDVITTNKAKDIQRSDKIILPGVGHFGKAMENLRSLDLINILHQEVLERAKPILGICLGMQLMASQSEEGNVNGLNWIPSTVEKLKVDNHLIFKIPHTGWNRIEIMKKSALFNKIDDQAEFYFVHSYHFNCANESDALCKTQYEAHFISGVQHDNIFGVQFHPEKSHSTGIQLLKNFAEI